MADILVLRGKSKDRLEIQWGGDVPIGVDIAVAEHHSTVLYNGTFNNPEKLNLRLEDLDFSVVAKDSEIELVAVVKDFISNSLTVQKCHHHDCQQWGHAKEDGYCKHCGRRIRSHNYARGFPKLELSNSYISLWNGVGGRLWKNKESYEINNTVYSWGQYEDAERPKDYVDILEEKFDPESLLRYTKLCELLQRCDLIPKSWDPPLVSFQEEYKRTLWIYYPRNIRVKNKQKQWDRISAYNYIISESVDALTTKEIVKIGILLCKIVQAIHDQGYFWGSLKLSDLIFVRNEIGEIELLLQTRDIVWDDMPAKNLLDTCLIPWELYWDNQQTAQLNECSEVYIIAAALYLLQAKSPNLLAYNPVSYPNGLPGLKLFPRNARQKRGLVPEYFESTLNQALILNPAERVYKNIDDFRYALESLRDASHDPGLHRKYVLDVGEALDVGDEKREHDFTPNQDAVFLTSFSLEKKNWGMFALCDGISTATVGSGEMASRIIRDTFYQWWQENSELQRENVCKCARDDFAKACKFLNSMVNKANERICHKVKEICGERDLSEDALIMGSTVTTGLVYDGIVVFGWIGDSPIYRFSKFGWERLNFADNERNMNLLSGKSLDDCYGENGNAITRCVGAHLYKETYLEMHFDSIRLYPNERILICSDGIPDYIEQESHFSSQENQQMLRIASILQTYNYDPLIDAKALSHILISSANRVGGGRDNLSAILLRTIPFPLVHLETAYERLRYLAYNSSNTKTSRG